MRIIGKLLKYFLVLLLLFFLVLITTMGVILWYYPSEVIAERIVGYGLNYYGLNYVRFNIKEASIDKIIVEDINLGDPNNFSIKSVEADYSLFSLLAKRINKIHIEGLKVHGLDHDNKNIFSFGTLDQLIAKIKEEVQAQAKNPQEEKIMPTISAVSVTNSDVLLNKPEQELAVPFSFLTERNNNNNYVSSIVFNQANIDFDKLEIPGVGFITLQSKISGTVPFLVENRKIILKEGDVFSSQNGVIRFEPFNKPPSSSDQNSMLYNLFSDFQYKDLSAKITMNEARIVKFNFQFEGSNKNFYNGQSVKLNVNLTISVEDLMKYTNLMIRLRS